MTTAFLAVFALTGPLATAANPGFHAQTDYGQALKKAANEKKPMAVLIGKGDVFAKMMADSSLTTEAKKLLTEKYVCVSVNVETEAGKTLAGQFQLADGGLVISGAGGTYQALRQSGSVSPSDFSKHVGTYANSGEVPATTVTVGVGSSTPVYRGTTPTYVYPAGGYIYPSAPFSSYPSYGCTGFR
jgi:hypothetical protein